MIYGVLWAIGSLSVHTADKYLKMKQFPEIERFQGIFLFHNKAIQPLLKHLFWAYSWEFCSPEKVPRIRVFFTDYLHFA